MSARTVVIALDGFKGSVSAADAVDAVRDGWLSVREGDIVVAAPMADGGEGTVESFRRAIPGATPVAVDVDGPDGVVRRAFWLRIDGEVTTGVVELASTSGIELLGTRRLPWDADSRGCGQAMAAALDAGVDRLVVGIGSSASTDGGLGLLEALGARVTDEGGAPVARGLRGLARAAKIDLTHLRDLPTGGVHVLTDVTHPLCGASGAAAVFGPQKGLDDIDIPVADAHLARWASLIGADPELPGAGAAGGVGCALAAWGATLSPGASGVAQLMGLDALLATADVVISGEGSFDAQSAHGKAPGYVSQRALAAGVQNTLIAGRITPDADLSAYRTAYALRDLAGSTAEAIAHPREYLRVAAQRAAADFADEARRHPAEAPTL